MITGVDLKWQLSCLNWAYFIWVIIFLSANRDRADCAFWWLLLLRLRWWLHRLVYGAHRFVVFVIGAIPWFEILMGALLYFVQILKIIQVKLVTAWVSMVLEWVVQDQTCLSGGYSSKFFPKIRYVGIVAEICPWFEDVLLHIPMQMWSFFRTPWILRFARRCLLL